MLPPAIQPYKETFHDQRLPNILRSSKPRLHYGKIRVKLVGFKDQKKIFCFLKPTNLAQILPQSKYVLTMVLMEWGPYQSDQDVLRKLGLSATILRSFVS